MAPAVIQEKAETKKEKQKQEEKREREKEKDAKEAKLVVELPADAKLFIDGTLMKSGSTKRGIVTPPLRPEQTYYYQVTVELIRHGHTLRETQRIRLIPGAQVNARFTNLENRAAAIVQAEKR